MSGNTLSAKELSLRSGKCLSSVYKLARKLGRLPTIRELSLIKRGRPSKYDKGG